MERNKVYIQIGTNNGKDEFNRIVRKNKPDVVILVEPNVSLNSSISKNYEGIGIIVVNMAITLEEGPVRLVIPNVENRRGINYGTGHFSVLPMDNWGEDFKNSFMTYGITFNELCRRHDITHIDYLQIDAEGFDTEIIKSIDFEHISIDEIKYEDWSFPTSVFSRYGKKAKDYGIGGMQQVEKLLTGLGYKLIKVKRDILAVK